ncbi:MAG: type II toxin-antitoxin system prevent-host-death family antitoxin [Vulcanimicrobiota bacterium]
MRSISKSKLKTHLLKVFRELEDSGEELIVTDRNRPVLRIVPYKERKDVKDAFSDIRGKLSLFEDPDLPTQDEWGDI